MPSEFVPPHQVTWTELTLTVNETKRVYFVARDARSWPVLVFGPLLLLLLPIKIGLVLLPLGMGLVAWRLIQYYRIRNKKPEIVTAQIVDLSIPATPGIKAPFETPEKLIEGYRNAPRRLWFAFLFWPIVLGYFLSLIYLEFRS